MTFNRLSPSLYFYSLVPFFVRTLNTKKMLAKTLTARHSCLSPRYFFNTRATQSFQCNEPFQPRFFTGQYPVFANYCASACAIARYDSSILTTGSLSQNRSTNARFLSSAAASAAYAQSVDTFPSIVIGSKGSISPQGSFAEAQAQVRLKMIFL